MMAIVCRMSQTTKPSSNTENTKFWRLLRVRGRITEAKHLDLQKTANKDTDAKEPMEFYCVARMDNRQSTEYVTQVVSSVDTPFWVIGIDKGRGFRI
jgi:hypothetical protein